MSTRWQHKVVEVKARLFGSKSGQHAQEELDKLGPQGWELVAVMPGNSLDSIRMFFKRPA